MTDKGSAVEAIPTPVDQRTNCSKVTKRVWQDGKIVSETVEEVCREPELVVVPPATYAFILLTRRFILTIITGEGPITTDLTATIVLAGMDLLDGGVDTGGKTD